MQFHSFIDGLLPDITTHHLSPWECMISRSHALKCFIMTQGNMILTLGPMKNKWIHFVLLLEKSALPEYWSNAPPEHL